MHHDKKSIQGPLPNVKIVDFPDDFVLRERYGLILTVRPLWETRRNLVHLLIYCSTTNSAGQLRRMNYLTFEEDNSFILTTCGIAHSRHYIPPITLTA
uniref:Uncharacterized protein n=1 Tax=Romanomermis culicivorax TaxID=13658 RepID=A0A915KAG0_ROMCU